MTDENVARAPTVDVPGVLDSPWAPLRDSRVFRAVWTAQVVSFLGNWMQTVGAQWFLIHDSTIWVALVQTAATAPYLLFGLMAGALADAVDHRLLLVGAQIVSLLVSAAMAVLSSIHAMRPISLLLLTFLLGSCAAVYGPALQATTGRRRCGRNSSSSTRDGQRGTSSCPRVGRAP